MTTNSAALEIPSVTATAEEGHGAGLSLLAGCGLGLAVLASGFLYGLAPLPLIFATAFIAIAVERDVRLLRIPNWLTFPGFALAVGLAALAGGLPGAGNALLGGLLALVLLLLPYSAGGLGAGDVKAMMALGALYGVGAVVPILAWSLGIGGALGLALVTLRGGLPALLGRWWLILQASVAARRWMYSKPEPGSAAAMGLPFAVAIGLGIVAYQVGRIPL